MDYLIYFFAALFSLLAGGVTTTELFRKLILKILGKRRPPKSYTERLTELTTSLTRASGEVDEVLLELTQVAKERERVANALESNLVKLERREKEVKDRITTLQNVPILVAEHFAKIVEPSARRSAQRDYFLFGAGVVLTTFVAIIIQIFTVKS